MQLARLCKYTLRDPESSAELTDLIDHFGVEMPAAHGSQGDVFLAVGSLLAECVVETSTVDFDDMLWLPVRHNLHVGAFDTLFVDECQDLSALQQTLARRAGQRLVVVGDARQAIYGFTGSDCDAMPKLCGSLAEEERGCADRPLTVTWRVPVSGVRLAQKIVPHIQPAPNAVEGRVGTIDPDDVWREAMPGDLVICRCNAPLIDLAYQLVSHDVPVMVRGRDLGKGLTDLVRKLKADNPTDLVRKLKDYKAREWARLERRDASESAFASLVDRCECLDTLASHADSIAALVERIETLFEDSADRSRVVLSSVHRAKGLEANRVIVAAPDKLPLIRKDSKPWQVTQEYNLAYIAATRHKQELLFAGQLPACFT